MSSDHNIGTLNEGSLHSALKRLYMQSGDQLEVDLDGFVIDIVRGLGRPDELLIEIQTASFGALAQKLDRLLGDHRILLVHPIAETTLLERPGQKMRRSPKSGSIFALFDELVSLPTMLDHPNLELEVVLVSMVKSQAHDPRARRGRGGWRTIDRRIDEVVETRRFSSVEDLVALIPPGIVEPFTTEDIAVAAQIKRDVAQRVAYCLRHAGRLEQIARTQAGISYVWSARG
ncbi:MAG: hypothetical protein ACR2PK_14270 [Acidimicrobiales bacterium]